MRYFIIILCLVVTSCNSKAKNEPVTFKNSIERGAEIYSDFCVTCHLPNGKGVAKVFPPLADSDYLMNNRALSIKAIKLGQNGEITVNGTKYNSVMAPLALSNEEVADVMNYITTSWGNKNDTMITPEEVSKIE